MPGFQAQCLTAVDQFIGARRSCCFRLEQALTTHFEKDNAQICRLVADAQAMAICQMNGRPRGRWIVLQAPPGEFIDDDRVLTDMEDYVAPLEAAGYKVTRLPRPEEPMETYVNALFTNGTVFMPSYDESTDDDAEAVYKSLGFKVVPLSSSDLSNNGKGSIHCITMTYPNAVKAQLLEWLTTH